VIVPAEEVIEDPHAHAAAATELLRRPQIVNGEVGLARVAVRQYEHLRLLRRRPPRGDEGAASGQGESQRQLRRIHGSDSVEVKALVGPPTRRAAGGIQRPPRRAAAAGAAKPPERDGPAG